uniref:Immunoglobulin domain-containing protein n=1 Tax=Ficedula albicollis TaxID=59894 RepID=A0A803VGQ6_FICAL
MHFGGKDNATLHHSYLGPVFGPRQVRGVLGGSVAVTCFYPPTPVNRRGRKYWCRQVGSRCSTVVSSDYVSPGYQGRAALSDHPEAENFQVNISQLELGDAGTFQCGVGVNGRGLSHRVTLSVLFLQGPSSSNLKLRDADGPSSKGNKALEYLSTKPITLSEFGKKEGLTDPLGSIPTKHS